MDDLPTDGFNSSPQPGRCSTLTIIMIIMIIIMIIIIVIITIIIIIIFIFMRAQNSPPTLNNMVIGGITASISP
jgi:heme/copper-type cytochrome/quinol oxidase subunit 2